MNTKTQELLSMAKTALVAMQMEAEYRNCGLKICDDAIKAIDEAIAQPAQEPVAWIYTLNDSVGEVIKRASLDKCDTSIVPFGRKGIDYSMDMVVIETPLYTSPPAREPVKFTVEEMQKIIDDWTEYDFVDYKQITMDVNKAIEKAHGIGGDDATQTS